jgi:hypothetical protein
MKKFKKLFILLVAYSGILAVAVGLIVVRLNDCQATDNYVVWAGHLVMVTAPDCHDYIVAIPSTTSSSHPGGLIHAAGCRLCLMTTAEDTVDGKE